MNQETLKTAAQSVRDIDFLLGNDEFNRFMEHFKARADRMADEILHSDMTNEEREKTRQFRLGVLEVLRGPQEIHRVNFALLNARS